MRTRPATAKFVQLADFARDIAARIEGTMSARPHSALRALSGRGRSPRPSSGGSALANIADHVLGMRLPHPMEAIEVALLAQAMTDTNGNITAAARLLGIHRKAVERKLAKHRLAKRQVARPRTTNKIANKTTKRSPPRRKPARGRSRA